MITIQDHDVNNSNYKKHVLKDPDTNKEICRKCQQKLETIQHITVAFRALAQDDYTHRHSQVANTVHQELAIRGTTNALL